MIGFPKVLKTGQDIENCLEMVKDGILEMSDLSFAIEAIENTAFLKVPYVEISNDRKTVTTRYCYEAKPGKAGNVTITKVEHKAGEDDGGAMGEAYAYTVITLETALPDKSTVIEIPVADPFEAMGITRARIVEIKGVLN